MDEIEDLKKLSKDKTTTFTNYELSVIEDAVKTGDVFANYLSNAFDGRFDDDWGRRKITEALVILCLKNK